jgi:hypothetical protein
MRRFMGIACACGAAVSAYQIVASWLGRGFEGGFVVVAVAIAFVVSTAAPVSAHLLAPGYGVKRALMLDRVRRAVPVPVYRSICVSCTAAALLATAPLMSPRIAPEANRALLLIACGCFVICYLHAAVLLTGRAAGERH